METVHHEYLPLLPLHNTHILGADQNLMATFQRTNTCSKSTMQTLEKGMKYVQSFQ